MGNLLLKPIPELEEEIVEDMKNYSDFKTYLNKAIALRIGSSWRNINTICEEALSHIEELQGNDKLKAIQLLSHAIDVCN